MPEMESACFFWVPVKISTDSFFLVAQALQTQHVHLLIIAFGINHAFDLSNGGVDLAFSSAARNHVGAPN